MSKTRFILFVLLLTPFVAFAQDVTAAVTDTTDLTSTIQVIIDSTGKAGGLPLVAAALLTLALAFLRGTVTIAGRRFALPFITNQIVRIPKDVLPWIIVIGSILVGGLTALAATVSAASFIAGGLQGLTVGLTAIGLYDSGKRGKRFLGEKRQG